MSDQIILRTACEQLSINKAGDCVIESTNLPFDTKSYSRLKYGSKKIVKLWGERLGNHLIKKYPGLLLSTEPPVAVVVYQVVPPACNALTQSAMRAINHRRDSLGFKKGSVVRIHKGKMLDQEYASKPLEVRQQILDNIKFDILDNNFTNKTVLFLDDVRITGTTEQKVCKTVMEHKPKHIICGYIGQFDESVAMADPQIETRMNSSYVKQLIDIADIINTDDFILNIRVLKRILRSNLDSNVEQFLRLIPVSIVIELELAARQSGLSNGKEFSKNYKVLKNYVSQVVK